MGGRATALPPRPLRKRQRAPSGPETSPPKKAVALGPKWLRTDDDDDADDDGGEDDDDDDDDDDGVMVMMMMTMMMR